MYLYVEDTALGCGRVVPPGLQQQQVKDGMFERDRCCVPEAAAAAQLHAVTAWQRTRRTGATRAPDARARHRRGTRPKFEEQAMCGVEACFIMIEMSLI